MSAFFHLGECQRKLQKKESSKAVSVLWKTTWCCQPFSSLNPFCHLSGFLQSELCVWSLSCFLLSRYTNSDSSFFNAKMHTVPYLSEIVNEVTVGTVPIKVCNILVIEVTDPVVAFHFKLLPENTIVNNTVPYRTRNRVSFMSFTLKPQHCEAEHVYMVKCAFLSNVYANLHSSLWNKTELFMNYYFWQ